jgi:hypothetical protein
MELFYIKGMNIQKTRFSVSALKRFFSRLGVCFVVLQAALLAFSCATPPRSGSEADFLFIKKDEHVAHANGVNHAKLSFNLVDGGESGALRKELRTLLYNGKSAEAYLRQTSSAWKKEYARADSASGDNASEASADWFYEEAHNVVRAGSCAVVKRSVAEFRGGARPDWREDSFVFDLAAPASRLNLDDIISAGGLGTVASLIDRELRRFSAAKTGKPLQQGTPLSRGIYLEDAIAPSEDFYPADNGLNFQWDSAEIAPHSEGAVEISIRWSELSGVLTPKGKALAAAFQPLK